MKYKTVGDFPPDYKWIPGQPRYYLNYGPNKIPIVSVQLNDKGYQYYRFNVSDRVNVTANEPAYRDTFWDIKIFILNLVRSFA